MYWPAQHCRASSRCDRCIQNLQDLAALRHLFEAAGAIRAQVEELERVAQRHKTRAEQREDIARDLRRQIDELRAQLARYGDALENDLAAGRERIATRVREALGYEEAFAAVSNLLLNHLKGRPECRELLEEFETTTAKTAISKLAERSLQTAL